MLLIKESALQARNLCDWLIGNLWIYSTAQEAAEYLDCEADAKLINFYEGEDFRLFGERISEKDGKRNLQYMKFF